jgi:hypothetical protein
MKKACTLAFAAIILFCSVAYSASIYQHKKAPSAHALKYGERTELKKRIADLGLEPTSEAIGDATVIIVDVNISYPVKGDGWMTKNIKGTVFQKYRLLISVYTDYSIEINPWPYEPEVIWETWSWKKIKKTTPETEEEKERDKAYEKIIEVTKTVKIFVKELKKKKK